MAAKKTRADRGAKATGPTRTTDLKKMALLLSEQVRRELAVVASSQGRELHQVAEEGLVAHLGKFALVQAMRKTAPAEKPGDVVGPAGEGDGSSMQVPS